VQDDILFVKTFCIILIHVVEVSNYAFELTYLLHHWGSGFCGFDSSFAALFDARQILSVPDPSGVAEHPGLRPTSPSYTQDI